MSFAIDVNVLLYASDSASPSHDQARGFLEGCATRGDLFYLAWPTLMSYLRMATHPALFAHPLSHDEAVSNVGAILALPHARVLVEEDGFWEIYQEVARGVPTRGNLVPDTHLAALLKQHGVRTLYTRDRDFLKFDFIEIRNPFS